MGEQSSGYALPGLEIAGGPSRLARLQAFKDITSSWNRVGLELILKDPRQQNFAYRGPILMN